MESLGQRCSNQNGLQLCTSLCSDHSDLTSGSERPLVFLLSTTFIHVVMDNNCFHDHFEHLWGGGGGGGSHVGIPN